MARRKGNYFQFNLLPAKSKALVEVEAERDDSLVYSIVLVFFALLVFFILTLARTLLVEPRVGDATQLVSQRVAQIESFNDVKARNGELFIKGETLEAILRRDLEAQEIFRVAGDISDFDPNVGIITYTREQSGLFVFDFLADDMRKAARLVQEAKNVNGVSDVFLRNVSLLNNGRVLISAELNIENV